MSGSSFSPKGAAVVVGEKSPNALGYCRQLFDYFDNVIAADNVDIDWRSITQADPDLILIAPHICPKEALRIVGEAKAVSSSAPVVVLANEAHAELAVRFIRAGAYDYVQLPITNDRLVQILVQTEACHKDKNAYFSHPCPPGIQIVGRSNATVKTLDTLRLVAESNCNPILLLGETGTGKELAARAVHSWRGDGSEQLIPVNCATLTANLLESELFGHAAGAFTDARKDKKGLLEVAGKGTIFLDEIGEMPLDLQAKLLRVVQERSFRKVGGTKLIRCQATIVAASNRNLLDEVKAGRFRQDLYYRLAVFPITLPPLRDAQRQSDIPLLAEYFIENSKVKVRNKIRGLSDKAKQKLMNHDWPGNVRELQNVIARALIVETADEISAENLLIHHEPEQQEDDSPASEKKDVALETAEKEFILRALRETGGQRTRAARLLGITRATLHTKLKKYNLAKSPAEALGTLVSQDQSEISSNR